jgi:hypothetical protein
MNRKRDLSPRRPLVLSLVLGGVMMLLGCAQNVSAQWNPSPSPSPNSNIYYDAGNVGIGTTNPIAALQVNYGSGTQTVLINTEGSSSATKQALTLQNPNGYGAGSGVSLHFLMANYDLGTISSVHDGTTSGQSNRLDFAISDTTPLMSILRNGRVGIGTTSPQADLSVNIPFAGTGNTGTIVSGQAGTTTVASVGTYVENVSTGATALTFNTLVGNGSLTEKMRIQNNGNVGIGTTTPVIRGGVASGLNISGSTDEGIQIDSTISGGNILYTGNSGSNAAVYVTNNATRPLYFGTGSYVAQDMVIDGSHNVGIGTTSPTAHLTISGNSISNGSTGIDFTNTTGNDTFRLAAGVPGVTNSNFSISQGGNSRSCYCEW